MEIRPECTKMQGITRFVAGTVAEKIFFPAVDFPRSLGGINRSFLRVPSGLQVSG
jgi:hypothetical protein